MDIQKGFITRFGEWWDEQRVYRNQARTIPVALCYTSWLPTRGNVLFTLVMIALLIAAQTAGALPLGRPQGIAPTAASTGTIAYQGRLADAAGAPLTGTYNMIFRLYAAATGGTPLWSEPWTGSNGVRVSDGLFNVMLGSLTALPQSVIAGRNQLFLGITVGTDDEMAPRVQLGSVPFAVQALTVPDGSVTTAKIADGAVTQGKLAPGTGSIPIHYASTTVGHWRIPACGTPAAIVPGLTLNITTDISSTLDISFSGFEYNNTAGSSSWAMLWVDGSEVLGASGSNRSVCRNGGTDPIIWCTLANVATQNVSSGTHTVDVRVGCDSGEVYIEGGWLVVRMFPR